MQLEMIPLLLGGLAGLVGLALVADAWAADDLLSGSERRKRPRRQRDRFGEALIGLGALALGAALVGLDTWRYTTVAVLAGAVLLLWGASRNRGYLRATFTRADRAKPSYGEGSRRLR